MGGFSFLRVNVDSHVPFVESSCDSVYPFKVSFLVAKKHHAILADVLENDSGSLFTSICEWFTF